MAASRRRACSRNFRGLFIKSRESSFPHVTTGSQRPSARAVLPTPLTAAWCSTSSSSSRSLSAKSPPLTMSREYFYECAKLDGRRKEHTCPRKPLTVSTREFQVAQLALIKKCTTPETSLAISSVVRSLERTEKRWCTEGLHPCRFAVLCCWSSRVIILSLEKTRTLGHQSGGVLPPPPSWHTNAGFSLEFFMIILCWFTVCYQ